MGRTIPWSELSDRERRNIQTALWERGIKVTVEEAERYYGNRELVDRDATRDDPEPARFQCPGCFGPLDAAAILGNDGDCVHCGRDLVETSEEGSA